MCVSEYYILSIVCSDQKKYYHTGDNSLWSGLLGEACLLEYKDAKKKYDEYIAPGNLSVFSKPFSLKLEAVKVTLVPLFETEVSDKPPGKKEAYLPSSLVFLPRAKYPIISSYEGHKFRLSLT